MQFAFTSRLDDFFPQFSFELFYNFFFSSVCTAFEQQRYTSTLINPFSFSCYLFYQPIQLHTVVYVEYCVFGSHDCSVLPSNINTFSFKFVRSLFFTSFIVLQPIVLLPVLCSWISIFFIIGTQSLYSLSTNSISHICIFCYCCCLLFPAIPSAIQRNIIQQQKNDNSSSD